MWKTVFIFNVMSLQRIDSYRVGGDRMFIELKNNMGESSIPHPKQAAEAASKTVVPGIPKIERKIKKL